MQDVHKLGTINIPKKFLNSTETLINNLNQLNSLDEIKVFCNALIAWLKQAVKILEEKNQEKEKGDQIVSGDSLLEFLVGVIGNKSFTYPKEKLEFLCDFFSHFSKTGLNYSLITLASALQGATLEDADIKIAKLTSAELKDFKSLTKTLKLCSELAISLQQIDDSIAAIAPNMEDKKLAPVLYKILINLDIIGQIVQQIPDCQNNFQLYVKLIKKHENNQDLLSPRAMGCLNSIHNAFNNDANNKLNDSFFSHIETASIFLSQYSLEINSNVNGIDESTTTVFEGLFKSQDFRNNLKIYHVLFPLAQTITSLKYDIDRLQTQKPEQSEQDATGAKKVIDDKQNELRNLLDKIVAVYNALEFEINEQIKKGTSVPQIKSGPIGKAVDLTQNLLDVVMNPQSTLKARQEAIDQYSTTIKTLPLGKQLICTALALGETASLMASGVALSLLLGGGIPGIIIACATASLVASVTAGLTCYGMFKQSKSQKLIQDAERDLVEICHSSSAPVA